MILSKLVVLLSKLVVFKVGGTTSRWGGYELSEGRWQVNSHCEGGVGAITVKCDVGVGRKARKIRQFN